MNETKIQLKGLSLTELQEVITELGEPKFRANQIYNWIYNYLEFDFDKMNNLSKAFREKLKEKCSLDALTLELFQDSTTTKTKKFLFKTFDDRKIESVVIPDKERNTLCLSTQVGCPLDCKFCATGLMGFKPS